MRIALLFYFSLLVVARPQTWIADYKYNANNEGEFLSSWNNVMFGMQVYAIPSFDGNTFSLVNNGQINVTEFARWDWNQNLPLNTSWTAITRLRSDFIVNDQKRWAIIQLSAGSESTNYFLDGSQTSINGQIVSRDQYFWMGLTYNFESRKILPVYSLEADQTFPLLNSFIVTESNFSTAGNEASTVPLINQIIFMPGGEVKYSDLKIVPYSVPEPSALSLLAVGLGGLAMMRRRRS